MDEQQRDSAGSSSAVEQHHSTYTEIRSRRYASDVAERIIASSDPSVPEDYEHVKAQSDNEPSITESSGRPATPPLATDPVTPVQEPAPESETKLPEERQCRICLAGAEEEAELGRLISPCLCRGSIRYVHVNCLKQWRVMSQNRSAFWSCPQCGFKYALARTRAVGLANACTASVLLFTIIVLLSSFLGTYFVPDAEALSEPQMTNQRDSDSFFSASFGGVVISPFDYYTYSWDTAKDVFKLAMKTFSDISNLEEEYEFWKKDDEEPDRSDILDDSRYESVHTSSKGFKSTVKIPQKTRSQKKYPKRKIRSPPSRFERFVRWFIYRFMTGLGVVGILSFLNLLFSVGLIAPLRLFGGNWTRGQRRAAANDTATLLVFMVIIIGVARAIWLVYKLTRHIAQLLLRRAETAILEVGQVEEDTEPEPWGPYLRRVFHELPNRARAIPYRLLPSMIFGWIALALVQGWHAVRNWTRDAVGQMIQVGPQQGVPVVGHQRGVFLGDW
ncbi:ring finger [Rhizoctonia solani]|uniref:Ring finger n=1 Tax=Rhizoctonia solani TaxID=456999 RepID=A0A8H7IJ50_9AGAM|nr:ring finger [Rhizoctonia solani]